MGLAGTPDLDRSTWEFRGWVQSVIGTRAPTIRADDKRSESVVLAVNFCDELRRRAPVDR